MTKTMSATAAAERAMYPGLWTANPGECLHARHQRLIGLIAGTLARMALAHAERNGPRCQCGCIVDPAADRTADIEGCYWSAGKVAAALAAGDTGWEPPNWDPSATLGEQLRSLAWAADILDVDEELLEAARSKRRRQLEQRATRKPVAK